MCKNRDYFVTRDSACLTTAEWAASSVAVKQSGNKKKIPFTYLYCILLTYTHRFCEKLRFKLGIPYKTENQE